jgi:release factor glutamine methyltransferase
MTDVRVTPDPPVPATWTVLSLLEWGSAYLAARGFDETRLHVEMMLGHVLTLKRLQLYLQFDRPLTPEELAAFKVLFKRRLEHEPLQYILGETGFMGIALTVAPGVLIPRPETELLVETALAHAKGSGQEKLEALDVGTGSGCIALSLAYHCPAVNVLGVDYSEEALVIARKNHTRYPDLHVTFAQTDIKTAVWPPASFDMIISNPPYIPPADLAELEPEVRDHEPSIALTDGGDGLTFYRVVFALAPKILRPGGVVMCEIGHGQAEAIRALAEEHHVRTKEIVADLAGIPRVFVSEPFTGRSEGY